MGSIFDPMGNFIWPIVSIIEFQILLDSQPNAITNAGVTIVSSNNSTLLQQTYALALDN
jgi:hypothetical protein